MKLATLLNLRHVVEAVGGAAGEDAVAAGGKAAPLLQVEERLRRKSDSIYCVI